MRRITAAVETCDNGQRSVGFDDEHQSIGKAADQGAADALVDDGELPGIGAHTLDDGVNRRAESSTRTGGPRSRTSLARRSTQRGRAG